MNLSDLKKEAREEFSKILRDRFNVKTSGVTNDTLGDIDTLIDRVVDAVEEAVVPIVEYAAKNINLSDKTPKYEYSRDDRDRNNAGEFPAEGKRWGMPREIAAGLEWNVKETFKRFREETE